MLRLVGAASRAGVIVGAVGVAILASVALADPGPNHPPAVATAEARLPRILTAADAERYRKVFRLQERARWREADRVIKKIDNRILMGHVRAQRYLHPCCYRSRYRELKAWLARYADHPQATRIYRLARKRRPKGAAYPRRPVISGGVLPPETMIDESAAIPRPRLSTKDRRNARYLRAVFSRNLRRGRLKYAARILRRKDAERLFGRVGYDEARARLAFAYFRWGRDEKALKLAGESARRSGAYLPFAAWTAGLAAWRLGRFEEAARQFESLARSGGISGWNVAAGAYWAARAHLIGHRPERVNRWLEIAAQYPRTFYGLLAARSLGLEPRFDWTIPRSTAAGMERLVASPYAERALALLQVGQTALAERELASVRHIGDDEIAEALLALADAADLPRLSLRVGRSLARADGRKLDGALYPLPRWRPKEGFIVDRALVYAVIRQESQFNSKAKSRSGARGLMQLMPSTASFIGRDRSLRRHKRNRLYNPELNISLGQRYLKHLLENEEVRGNLFLAAAAYNAGPGNVAKWQRRIDYQDDPLLFIESLPSRETRIYIERVFTNLWIYRQRLGQPTPSLDAIAAGKWPVYEPLDDGVANVAANVADESGN